MVGLVGCQQPHAGDIDRALIGEVLTHSEFAANLRTLAMPGGRLTGTPNAERAGQFVADKLRAYGLQNVHFEPFEMSCWTVKQTRVTLLSEPPCVLAGAVALARTLPTPPGGITAELIDLGEGAEQDFAARGDELRGKFVLVQDDRHTRKDKLLRARQHGAVGLVVMSPSDHVPIIGNGHLTPRPEPAVVIPHDEQLLDRLGSGERIVVNIELDTDNWHCRPNNVVAELPGRGPLAREIVILCAHLDSWHLAEGALDNGSGSAVILETARALARVGEQPRRTIRFIWFMGEEQMLEGSEAYVRAHADELDRVVAVVNVDMPGSPRRFGVFGHHEIEPFLRSLSANLAGFELDAEIGEWSGDGSDHAPFMKQGVCTLSLGGELGPGVKGYHTAGDTYDSVDRRGTVQSAAVLSVVVRHLADAPERPTRRLPPAEPDHAK